MIDNSIPLPCARTSFSDLDNLEIGESATYPLILRDSLSPSINYRQIKHGKKFIRRTCGGVIRVWRVS
jgi:hypothetical protein